ADGSVARRHPDFTRGRRTARRSRRRADPLDFEHRELYWPREGRSDQAWESAGPLAGGQLPAGARSPRRSLAGAGLQRCSGGGETTSGLITFSLLPILGGQMLLTAGLC